MGAVPHISVCICTFKRERLLTRLLNELARQETKDRFTFSIVVVDNDSGESAKPVVETFRAATKGAIEVVYVIERERNISAVRNTAVRNAKGEYLAFIDDDEYPIQDWLLTLFALREEKGVDGVLGPVKPYFEQDPPAWVVKGRFYDRTTYPTGLVIDWPKGRTGNVLLRRAIFEGEDQPFKPDFITGEDQDFFRRMIAKGHVFVWCDEAVAYEVVPPVRWQLGFMLRRALLRGKVSLRHPNVGPVEVAKSAVAIPAYSVALPFLALCGKHYFISYLVKTCDHLGRLMAFVGISPVRDQYVTE